MFISVARNRNDQDSAQLLEYLTNQNVIGVHELDRKFVIGKTNSRKCDGLDSMWSYIRTMDDPKLIEVFFKNSPANY